jgi:KaiC/GvpD/RAD55 family RecA-like ATPase
VSLDLKETLAGDISRGKNLLLRLTTADRLKTDNIDIVKMMVDKDYHVIIITTNQPSGVLKKNYEKSGIDLSSLFFIDAITSYAIGTTPPAEQGVRFISNPANLTDIGIAITSALNEFSDKRPCILFDAVSTMLIYLPSANISKFIHYISNRLRLIDTPGIFLAVGKGLDPMMISNLSTFMDDIIQPDVL